MSAAIHPFKPGHFGYLAKTCCGRKLPLHVLHSAAGYYIGTVDEEGPVSRESLEYYERREQAEHALQTNSFTQRETP